MTKGSGGDRNETGAPSTNFKGVPEDIRAKLNGVYFGWTSLSLPTPEKSTCKTTSILEGWMEAIVTVAPSAKATPTVAPNKQFKVYVVQDFGGVQFFGAKMQVMVLGYLHPFKAFDPELSKTDLYKDIAITQLSLARPAWKAGSVMDQIRLAKKGRSLVDKYVNARQYGQKQLDKVPLHMLGVRTGSMGIKGKWIDTGGFSIPR